MSEKPMEAIQRLRCDIDGIDQELLRLLNRRAELVLEIGSIKKQAQLPVHYPDREKAIMERLGQLNPGPLKDAQVRCIYERVIEEMRNMEMENVK